MRSALRVTLLVLCTGAAVKADVVPEDAYYRLGLRPHYEQAAAATARGDHRAAAAALARALALAPYDAITLWEAAGASARAGDRDRALDLLEKLGSQRPGWTPGADSGFAGLEGNARFAAVASRLALRRPEPRVAVAVAHTVSERDVIPEGLAWDRQSRTLFLSSIHKRKVIAIGPDGTSRDFTRSGQDGLLQALGMKVEGGLLWVASYAGSGPDACASAVHAFDVRTGRTVEKYDLPAGTGQRLLNDLVLVGKSVYVTESLGGALYRVDRAAKKLEEFLPAGTFIYPNGVAAAADGKRLFVASWGPGVSIVDLGTRRVSQLASVPGSAPIGIDGLYHDGRGLLAVQNGVEPSRVTRFELDEGEQVVVDSEVLVAAHPDFEIPTTGALAGDSFFLIANSQLRREKDGRIVKPTEAVRILRVPLD